MQRVTITLDDDLLEEIDALAAARGDANRSEIIRDLARAGLAQARDDAKSDEDAAIGALVYVYDHAARNLSHRLMTAGHHHDVSVATLHIHVDDDTCLEMTALKGRADEITHFAEHVIGERGVRYGRLMMIPTK